jgi:hypothetical protein
VPAAKALREEINGCGPERRRKAGRTTKRNFDGARLDTGAYRRVGVLKQKTPEEQYAQDQDKGDDDDFDEAHFQVPYAPGELTPEKRKARQINERASF